MVPKWHLKARHRSMVFGGHFGRLPACLRAKMSQKWLIFGHFLVADLRRRFLGQKWPILNFYRPLFFGGKWWASPRFASRIGGRFLPKSAIFGRFGSRGRWWVDPMVPVSWAGHLKQQVSVTWATSWPQKVHKVGQLSEKPPLAASRGLWHLG